jgi:hypothetical protein
VCFLDVQGGRLAYMYINYCDFNVKERRKQIKSSFLRDSSVGIVSGYGLDDQGEREFESRKGKNFHFSISSRPALGSTQPPIK